MKLVYVLSGDEDLEGIFEGQEMSFMRLISTQGVSSYRYALLIERD